MATPYWGSLVPQAFTDASGSITTNGLDSIVNNPVSSYKDLIWRDSNKVGPQAFVDCALALFNCEVFSDGLTNNNTHDPNLEALPDAWSNNATTIRNPNFYNKEFKLTAHSNICCYSELDAINSIMSQMFTDSRLLLNTNYVSDDIDSRHKIQLLPHFCESMSYQSEQDWFDGLPESSNDFIDVLVDPLTLLIDVGSINAKKNFITLRSLANYHHTGASHPYIARQPLYRTAWSFDKYIFGLFTSGSNYNHLSNHRVCLKPSKSDYWNNNYYIENCFAQLKTSIGNTGASVFYVKTMMMYMVIEKLIGWKAHFSNTDQMKAYITSFLSTHSYANTPYTFQLPIWAVKKFCKPFSYISDAECVSNINEANEKAIELMQMMKDMTSNLKLSQGLIKENGDSAQLNSDKIGQNFESISQLSQSVTSIKADILADIKTMTGISEEAITVQLSQAKSVEDIVNLINDTLLDSLDTVAFLVEFLGITI